LGTGPLGFRGRGSEGMGAAEMFWPLVVKIMDGGRMRGGLLALLAVASSHHLGGPVTAWKTR